MKKKPGKKPASRKTVVSMPDAARKIFLVRGHKVMIDNDLAALYEVPTKALNQAVKRNKERFPEDFMFQLTEVEAESLRSHFVTSKKRRYLPFVFTEQGVAMLSSVLKSGRAIQVNIAIMRAFVRIRELATTNKVILQKVRELERKTISHDAHIKEIFTAIKDLAADKRKPVRRIGFHQKK